MLLFSCVYFSFFIFVFLYLGVCPHLHRSQPVVVVALPPSSSYTCLLRKSRAFTGSHSLSFFIFFVVVFACWNQPEGQRN